MDEYLIDHSSAMKMLEVLRSENIDGEAFKSIFAATIARKLGESAPPVPPSSDVSNLAKFARFFDNCFKVAPERKVLPTERVLALIDIAIDKIRRREEEAERDGEDDMRAMYETDRNDYYYIGQMIREGHIKDAMSFYHRLDTAARDRLFGRTDEEDVQLRIFINENS